MLVALIYAVITQSKTVDFDSWKKVELSSDGKKGEINLLILKTKAIIILWK